jgi:ketosteroid isomerase-like protein
MSNSTFTAHMATLRQVLKSFPVTPIEIHENPTKNQVVVWATAEATFHDNVKDDGLSEEEWKFSGEYMFVLDFEEGGEKLVRVLEFLDSLRTEKLRGLIGRAKGNLERSNKGEREQEEKVENKEGEGWKF